MKDRVEAAVKDTVAASLKEKADLGEHIATLQSALKKQVLTGQSHTASHTGWSYTDGAHKHHAMLCELTCAVMRSSRERVVRLMEGQ